ncbi:hypothetical protein HZC31_04340 [Candidatus Woesearchaeota archaeon]|nr:hypothetical protein [Candidatus Woesearchaeota archaeon]
MTSIKTLKKIDWILHLERKSNIFYVSIFYKAYSTLMEQETGFRFRKELCWYKDGFATTYRSDAEMKAVVTHFLKIIKEKNPKLQEWIKKGKQYQKREETLMKRFSEKNIKFKKQYREIIDEMEHIFLYLTCIPWYVLYAMEQGMTEEEQRRYEKIRKEFQAFRKKTRRALQPVIEEIWKQAAEITKRADSKDYAYCTTEEVREIFEKQKDVQEISKRKNGCWWYFDEREKAIFLYDEKIKEKLNIVENSVKEQTEVQGRSACAGIVQGRVCIINAVDDMDKFQEGDIIVSINTNPTLLPVLEKCKAIVTNEGGLICHAAIIAREIKKPCIIGTKIATKILKDGDLVEVDAEKGIVRKIQ